MHGVEEGKRWRWYQNFTYSYKEGKTTSQESDILEKYRKNGYCRESIVEEIEHPLSKYIDEYLESKVEQLTLQVTQSCNLRCDYCVYSGKYENRVHCNKNMSFDVAKKAIDYIIKHSYEIERINISFYGGEPLINFTLIKQCVQYIKENYPYKLVDFGITTNGTLLNEEISYFLDSNNFTVLLSLDGPSEIQNLHRKFIDGQGSFDTIIHNLEKVRKKYPQLYSRIAINTVISPENDISCVKEFFELGHIVNELRVMFNYTNELNLSQSIKYDEMVSIINRQEECKVLLWCLKEIDEKCVSKAFRVRKDEIIRDFLLLNTNRKLTKKNHPSGPCIVGCKKMFVSVEGEIFPCERCSEKSHICQIGTLEKGVEINKVLEIMNIGKITEEKCKNCWAFQKCSLCVIHCDGMDKLSAEMKLKSCEIVKQTAIEDLLNICFLEKNNFDYQGEVKNVY